MVYAITYDLNKDGQNYQLLFKTIQEIGIAIHALQNLWLVDAYNYSATTIRKKLVSVLDKNDFVFVTQVTTDWDGWLKKDLIEWLQNRV